MTKDQVRSTEEALKLALEAFEVATTPFARDRQEVLRAQAALREALAEQPAQTDWEAVAADQAMTIALLKAEQLAQHQCKWPTCQNEQYQQALAEQIKQELYTGPAQQEPVAWMVKVHGMLQRLSHRADVADELACQYREDDPNAEVLPLYTSPPAQHECSRSHPHENMDAMCELRTEIARLTNENARLKAQRTWVGLTDEEISLEAHNIDPGDWNDLRFRDSWHEGFKEGARAIEAKLKEKNQ